MRTERVAAVSPVYVLGTLLLVQWLAVLAFSVTVRHNGWLFYSGGDQLWNYTGAYLLAHGSLPPAFVGYGWSILLLPLAPFAGPNLVSALPGLVLFNTLVLLPVALLCVYGIGARLAGRLFGYWAAAVWIALPYFGILFVEPGYHQKYTELTLPHVLGLTAMSDFPTMVGLLVSAYFCLRALESGSWVTMGASGLALGYAIAIKPSSAIFLFAPAVLLLAKRWQTALPFVLGVAPALLTLALWKYRGLGQLGASGPEPIRIAGGIGDFVRRVHNPETNSWSHFVANLSALREHFWVARVLEYVPIAGAIALLARSRNAFLLIGTWFFAFLAIKGSYHEAQVDNASFFRILLPAFPAFVLLTASIVLLVPRVRAKPAPRTLALRGRRLTVAATTAFTVFAVLPLAVVAAVPKLHDAGTRAVRVGQSEIPVDSTIGARATASGDAVQLDWQAQPSSAADVFYRVFRSSAADGGLACANTPGDTSDDCRLGMDSRAAIKTTSFVDKPGSGTWTYRIGVSANWLNDLQLGDDYVVSPPVTVRVP
ncbi:MAG: hypothetical protein V7645_113 [Actinomycetota bacterium]